MINNRLTEINTPLLLIVCAMNRATIFEIYNYISHSIRFIFSSTTNLVSPAAIYFFLSITVRSDIIFQEVANFVKSGFHHDIKLGSQLVNGDFQGARDTQVENIGNRFP